MIRSICETPFLSPLLLLSVLLVLSAGCASPSATGRAAGGDPAGDSTRAAVLEMMRTLEREPLSAQAPFLRDRAFAWVATAPETRTLEIDASYLKELDNGNYVFKGEMMMQFVFGMVLWRFSPEGEGGGRIAQVEGGLRSMIAAYRNILLADKKLTDPWLDRVDELRRLGKLRGYAEELEARR